MMDLIIFCFILDSSTILIGNLTKIDLTGNSTLTLFDTTDDCQA